MNVICGEGPRTPSGCAFGGYRLPGGTREKHAYHRLNSVHASGVRRLITSARLRRALDLLLRNLEIAALVVM